MIQAFNGVKSRGTEAGFYSEDFPNPNMSPFTAVREAVAAVTSTFADINC